MTIRRNKDNEMWDDETGVVYNDDGTTKRPGLPRTTPDVAAARVALGISEPEAEAVSEPEA